MAEMRGVASGEWQFVGTFNQKDPFLDEFFKEFEVNNGVF
jgi:hypothetical protein